MKAYYLLAWKELKAQKITSILILIAIVLSTMMTTVVGQSLGILQDLREQQAGSLNGYRYAAFHNISEKQKAQLEQDSRLSFVGSNIILGMSELKNSGISLQLREYDQAGLSAYPTVSRLQEGRLPQKAGEIALPQDALDFLDFSGGTGDYITLNLRASLRNDTQSAYEYQETFTLCGILKSNYIGYSTGLVTGIAGQGSAMEVLPERYRVYSTDIRTEDKQDFQKTINNLVGQLGIDETNIQYNWLYLNALGIPYNSTKSNSNDSGFSYMTVTAVLIGALVLLAAGLVIYNILRIAVSKRIKGYGILRAIGGQRGQLYRLVSGQIILLCAVGIPLGAICGILSSGGITKAATSFFSPQIFMTQNTEELAKLIEQNTSGKILPLIISAVITLVFAFIAAIPAVRYAAGVSPTVAMSGTTDKMKRKNRRDKPIRNFEAFYARLNLKRNAGRTVITILSLMMSVTVFVALQSFSGLLDASQDVQDMHLGDYSITNDVIGFELPVAEDLKAQKGVSSVSTLKYSLYMQEKDSSLPIAVNFSLKPAETLQIVGVDEKRLQSLLPSLTAEDIHALIDGKACLITNPVLTSYEGKPLETTSFFPGDKISIANTELKVLGNSAAVGLDNTGFVNGVQVVVFDTVYDKLTGKNTYSELYPALEEDADIQAIEQKIEEICDKTPGSRWLSYQNTDKQLAESFEQIKLLAWGLIFFIGLIGLLNIVNTTYTNIHTRINEIGIQRAIGISTANLYKTFLWEGAYYGIIAAVLGAMAGYICTIFAGAAATDQFKFVALPIIPVLQAAPASIGACLLAVCVPLRRIAKMSIADSIEAVE